MTSWLHVPPKKKEDGPTKPRPYFVSLMQDEFCSHFNTLFYSRLFSETNQRDLLIYDMSTVISPSFSLLQETFAPMKGVEYVSEMKPSATVLRAKDPAKIIPLLNNLSQEELRSAARSALTWNPAMLEKVSAVIEENSLPEEFDAAVHIRSPVKFDRVRAPAVQTYVEALQALAKKLGKDDMSVFVMVDEVAQFEEFRKLAPKTWVLHTVRPRNSIVRGGRVGTMGRNSIAIKMAAYVEFITELYCMQHSMNVICNLSNDTGRFIYLTANAASLRSLDTPAWTPF